SDLNRTARTTSKSLNILYNHRDLMSQVTLSLIERVEVFKGTVDKDRISLPLRSPKLFTLGAIYDATTTLLGGVTEEDFDQKVALGIDFWEALAKHMKEWQKSKAGDLKPVELRQEYINSHAVVLWGLGGMGQTLITNHPDDWKKKLSTISSIDWRRTNKEWQ